MKPFHFSLERLRSYRQQLLDREKNLLSQLRRKLMELEAHMDALRAQLLAESRDFQSRQRRGVTGAQVMGHRFSQENGKRKLEELELARQEASEEVERQLAVVVAATQDVSSLDKLEERQREDYLVLAAKEQEKLISEFVSVKVIRSMRA